MKKALTGFILLLIALVPVMAEGSGEQTENDAINEITILINDSPWFAGFEALVGKYEKETGVKVNLNVTPFPGMLQKTRNAVRAKESEYDLINLNEGWFMEFYKDGLMTPINDIDPDFKLDPEVIEYDYATRWNSDKAYTTADGELYGLPINGNIQILYYRKDLYEEKGLEVPTTWDELIANSKALHNPPETIGFLTRTTPADFEVEAYLHSHGGGIVDIDLETGEWEVIINTTESKAGLKTWLELALDYGAENVSDIGQSDMLALMMNGKGAQCIMVSAAAPNLQDEKQSIVVDKVATAPVPGGVAVTGIWVMGIPHNLPMERKTVGLDFLKWSLKEENQLYYANAGAIPVRKDTYEELAKDPEQAWWAQTVADSTPMLVGLPRPATAQIMAILDRWNNELVIGNVTVDEAADNMAEEIYKALIDAGYAVKSLD